MSSVQILIADDHESFRRSVRSLIESHPDYRVCGEAGDGIEAVEKAYQLRPDIVLMDINMPRMDGLEATRIIRREVPECSVIIVTQNHATIAREQARQVDARGAVTKADLPNDLLPTIERVFGDANPETEKFANGSAAHAEDWVRAGGALGKLVHDFDWTKTPLGPMERWPQALKTVVCVMLASRFAMWMSWGPELTFLYNDAYAKMTLGKKHPWALGKPSQKVWEEIWDDIRPRIQRVFETGQATWDEALLLFLERSGYREETYHTFSYSPLAGDDGKIAGHLCVVTEETDRVIGERRLRTLRSLAAESNKATTEQDVVHSVSRILSGNQHDLPFTLTYLLSSDGKQAHLACRSGIAAGHSAAPEVMELTGSSQPWPIHALLSGKDSVLVEDLTARFDSLPAGAWDSPPARALLLPITTQAQSTPAGVIVTALNPYRPLDVSYAGFLNLIAVQIGAGIANARAYEEEKKRAEALAEIDRAKTLFFSNVSHEFRTPLTLMLAPLEDMLSHPKALSPQQHEQLDIAHRNSLRLLKLVNTLLDFSRIEAGRFEASYEPTDLSKLTSDLASVFRSSIERAGLRFIVNCPGLDEPVYVDRELWEKIVFNLLSNAFKFTFEGEIEVSVRRNDAGIELTMGDTGTGIPAEDIPHLFERFYRVKNAQGRTFEGSGIGLALVQELTKQHGGTVRVESEVGRGSTFTVTIPFGKVHLPADRIGVPRTLSSTALGGEAYLDEALHWLPDIQRAPDLPLVVPAESPDFLSADSRPRILLADDNADMREYLRKLLSSTCDVQTVGDGEAALAAIRANPPDLVLTDVMMPKLDGFALLKKLRSQEDTAAVPVIMLSARAGEESRVEGLTVGADDYLTKPFSARELLARVRSHLRMARTRREASALERKLTAETELARKETQQREQSLRDIIDTLPAAIYTTDAEGRLTHFNPAAVEFSGRTPQLGTDHWCVTWKLFRPDGTALPHDECPMAIALKEGRIIEGAECIAERPDGTRVWFTPYPRPLRDADGKIVGGINMLVEITARKQAEEASGHLAAIVASSDDAIISKNLDGMIRSWNKSAERLFGYTAEEAIGRHITLIIPKERWDEETEILKRLRRGERLEHFQTVRRRKDGSTVDLSLTISPVKDSAGRVIGASKVARDISEQKQAERALRQSEARLAAEAHALARLTEWSWRLWRSQTLQEGLDEMLPAAIELVGADKGNIQLLDPDTNVLRIVAQHGFEQNFLHHFREVSLDDCSACARAWHENARLIVEDIEQDEAFAPLRPVMRAAGVRSVISTPLVSPEGKLLGVISTHFLSVHQPTEHDLRRLDLYIRLAADFIQRCEKDEALRRSEERLRKLSETLESQIRARTRELEEQSVQIRELSWRLLRTQDEERRRIARELHDSAGQTLTVLGINLAQVLHKTGRRAPEIAADIEEIQETVQQLHREIRTASYLLHPPLLDEAGLYSAISWYVQGLAERSGLDIHLDISDEFGRLSREMELIMFRLVQECLTNIHRHSESKTAAIRMTRNAGQIMLEIQDQGKGMTSERLAEIQAGRSGVGIRGMRERLRQFEGTLNIESNSSGTRILIHIPIPKSAASEDQKPIEPLQAVV